MASFEIIDSSGAAPPPGPWEARPAPAASFSTRGAPQTDQIWRVNLSADLRAAEADLRAAEADLRAQELAIAQAPEQIGRLAAAEASGAVSFSVRTLPAPHRQLLGLVRQLRGQPEPDGDSAGPAASIEETQGHFQAFLAQVQGAINNLAQVETAVDGLLVARTTVGWTGDVRSLIIPRLSPDHNSLHRRTLGLALGSRLALLRTFGTVTRAAGIVAMMASSPAGAAMALPAAWRFIDQLLSDLRARQRAVG